MPVARPVTPAPMIIMWKAGLKEVVEWSRESGAMLMVPLSAYADAENIWSSVAQNVVLVIGADNLSSEANRKYIEGGVDIGVSGRWTCDRWLSKSLQI